MRMAGRGLTHLRGACRPDADLDIFLHHILVCRVITYTSSVSCCLLHVVLSVKDLILLLPPIPYPRLVPHLIFGSALSPLMMNVWGLVDSRVAE